MAERYALDAVIFDLDDTLLDWSGHRVTWAALNRPHLQLVLDHLRARGLAAGASIDALVWSFTTTCEETWAAIDETLRIPPLTHTLERSLERLGLATDVLDMDELLCVFDWRSPPNVRPFGDTLEVLHELRARGYKLGVITNSFMPMQMRLAELREHQMDDLFEVLISSGDVGILKPHPRIFEICLERLGVPASRALFIGDSPTADIKGAQSAGMLAALHIPRNPRRELFDVRCVPDFTLTRMWELIEVINRMELYHRITSEAD